MHSATHTATYARTLDALPELLDHVESFAQSNAIPARSTHDLLLVVEELFTNQVRHQPPSDTPLELELRVQATREIVVVLVDRKARRFDLRAAATPNVELPAAQRPEGGMGVHLIRSLAASVDYEYGDGVSCTTVRLSPPS